MRNPPRALLAAALLALLPGTAAAAHIALEANLLLPSDDRLTDDFSNGFSLRFGSDYSLGLLTLSPEISLGYANLGQGREPGIDLGPDAPAIPIHFDVYSVRALAGARLGLPLGLLRPGVFAHLGYGWAVFGVDADASKRDVSLDNDHGLAWDAGVSLDFTPIPVVEVGVHAAYNRLELDEAMGWTSVGAHLALAF